MRYAALILAATLAAAVAWPAPAPAAPAPDVLERLKSKVPGERFEAAVELGLSGGMTHTPPLASLLADENTRVRAAANRSLWMIWMRSGDAQIDALMLRGVSMMNAGNLEGAIGVFAEMIRKKPAYAEGWNKRATALWMAKRYRESIADCEKVIELNPYHFGALSGMGLNYMGLEDFEGALDAFRRTLKVLPHSMSTRRYIEMLEKALEEKLRKI